MMGGYEIVKTKTSQTFKVVIVSASLLSGFFLILLGIKRTELFLNTIVNSNVIQRKRNTEYIYVENIPKEETEGKSLFNWWYRKKRLLPWNLLEIANSSCPKDRERAVETLASYKNLYDHEYQHIAQASTPHTAVSLARVKDVDQRFFLKTRPSIEHMNKKYLLASMRDLLEKLNKETKHPCLKYFLGNVFPTAPKFSSWTYFNDFNIYGFVGIRPSVTIIPKEEITLSLCIKALLHHCIAANSAKAIVEAGALPLLLCCYKELHNDIDACVLLSKLIIELSIYPEYLKDFYQTGWVAVLAEWLQHKNQRLSVAAASCLANLDNDLKMKAKYESDVLLLHPSFRTKQETKTDIVLIHGLLGGVHYTWKQRGNRKEPVSIFGMTSPTESVENLCARTTSFVIDEAPCETDIIDISKKEEELESSYVFVMSDIPVTEYSSCDTCCDIDGKNKAQLQSALNFEVTNCWPKDWLPEDCNNLRVVGINYETRLTDWISWCPLKDTGARRVLAERCRKLLQKLIECGIGERPVIWITHSMGGLLVKHILVEAWKNSHLENMKSFYENTKGIVFISTPHIGSPWATFHEAWRILFLPSTEVDELRFKSPVLEKLHEEFKKFINENPMEIISFVETKSVKFTQFKWEFHCVPPDLGDPGFGTIYKIPLGHMDICKPEGKFSFIYQRILKLVRSIAATGMK